MAIENASVSTTSDTNESRISRSATRYLCTGAWLDRDFRQKVIRSVLDQPHRAVAPSYSIDVEPIIKHALAANRREIARDSLISVVLIVSMVISFKPVLGVLALLYALNCGLRALAAFVEKNLAAIATYLVVGFVLLLVGAQALKSAAAQFSGETVDAAFGGDGGSTVGHAALRIVIAVLVEGFGTMAVLTWYYVSVHRTVLNELTDNMFRPENAPRAGIAHEARLAYLRTAQHGNVTMYAQSRRADPFVGCGSRAGSWSVPTPLTADPLLPHEPVPGELTTNILYDKMRHALIDLVDRELPEAERLDGLALQNRIFVSGLLPPGHPLIGPDLQPRLRVRKGELQQLSQDERNRISRYLTARVSGWQGELDITAFMYFSIRGHMLYFEFLATSLPPIKAAYHQVDAYERMSGAVTLRSAITAAFGTPFAIAAAPINLLTPMIDSFRRSLELHGQMQMIATRLAFDFGALGSVREFGAELQDDTFFHTLDASRYIRVVERRAQAAIVDVLEEFGYSAAEFVERSTLLINNGNINSGNNNTNSAVAMGAMSSASQTRAGRTAGGAGATGGGTT